VLHKNSQEQHDDSAHSFDRLRLVFEKNGVYISIIISPPLSNRLIDEDEGEDDLAKILSLVQLLNPIHLISAKEQMISQPSSLTLVI
jgi:hypothetical protein